MLALVGSGEYLPPMDPVDRYLLARLPGPPRVVCLPTAAGTEGAERIGYWDRLGVEHFAALGAAVESLPVIDAASANDPALADKIAAANFVYLSGGHPDYLQKTLAGSECWRAVQSVLAKGGLLAGCSAGAMVCGERIFNLPPWRTAAGFNLLPGTLIVPHFDEIPAWIPGLQRLLLERRITVIGIERNTALFAEGDTLEVVGGGGVTVWNRAGKRRYRQGALPPWPGI
jgi:cyanophycinase